MLARILILCGLLAATTVPATADPQQDFIIARANEQYRTLVRQAGTDAAKKSKLQAIYKKVLKAVQSKPGLDGRKDAEVGFRQMQQIVSN